MLVHFRTRGGPTQGWGNIYRLAHFAAACRERHDASVRFLVEGPPAASRLLRQRGFEAVELDEDITVEAERELVRRLPPAEMTIMEMLDCRAERQAMLKEFTTRLVVFDDLLDHRYCADLVVCGQELPGYGNRAISAPHTRFLIGYPYFIADAAYRRYAEMPRDHAGPVRRLLVALGGGRYDLAYVKTALAIRELAPDFDATFILGPAARDGLAEEIAGILPSARILGGVDDMHAHLRAADLAVVSAGYLKLEAALTRTPAVTIATQWHQVPLAETFQARAGMPTVGYMSFFQPTELAAALDALLSPAARDAQVRRCAAVVDGGGLDRTYEAVFGPAGETPAHPAP